MGFVGDQSYHLSPLTEMSRYGRGAQAEGYFGRFMVGGFYQKPRFYPYIKDETAAYASYKVYKENSIGVSYLRKTYNEIKDDSHLFSLNFNLQPFKNSLLEVEFSKGITGNKSGYGFYTNFVGNWKRVNVVATLIYSGKYYPGYYSNSLFYNVSASWRITRKLSVNAGIRHDYQNAAQDTLFGAAPFNQGYYAGVGYQFTNDINLRLNYNYTERMDRAQVVRFHYRENSLKMYLTQSIKNFSYNLNGEIGKTENLLMPAQNSISDSYRVGVDMYYDLRNWLHLGAFVSFMSNNRYSVETENSWIYGASVTANLTNNLWFTVWYQSDYELEDYYRMRSLFNATLDWRITKNHSVNIMANYALQQKQVNATDYSAAVTYTWHFGIPLKKTGVAGTVNGKIVSSSSVSNVKGIILYLNGHTVITNQDGSFSFKNLKPGTYYLLIDRSTLRVHDIPDVPLPVKVDVAAEKETFVTFGITKAARVKGTIRVKSSNNGSKLWDEKTAPGHIILELLNGKESVKIISDDDGTFKFPDVHPGKWTLKAYPNGLSGKYKIDKDQFELNLKEGDEIIVPVVLKRKQKKIIFMSDKLTLSENLSIRK
jgi:hypothetical protein